MMTIHDIENKTAKLRGNIEQAKGKRDLLISQERQKQVELKSVGGNISTWEQVQLLLSRSSEYAREQLKTKIEETVTAALRCVFEDSGISFSIELGQSGGNPTANWQVISSYKDYEVAANPEDARGGAVVDVVSLGLRIALLELARPHHDGPLILDEPGKHVSAGYVGNLAVFLKEYARRTSRQVIMITHQVGLANVADKNLSVSMHQGISEVYEYV